MKINFIIKKKKEKKIINFVRIMPISRKYYYPAGLVEYTYTT